MLVSTLGRDGASNLAPFSMVTPLSASPPLLGLSILPRSSGEPKRTLANIEAGGDFVVNVVTRGLLSAAVEPARRAALELVPAEIVRAPRVAASPVQLECRLYELLRPRGSQAVLVVGEVVCFHLEGSAFQGIGHVGTEGSVQLFGALGEVLRIEVAPPDSGAPARAHG